MSDNANVGSSGGQVAGGSGLGGGKPQGPQTSKLSSKSEEKPSKCFSVWPAMRGFLPIVAAFVAGGLLAYSWPAMPWNWKACEPINQVAVHLLDGPDLSISWKKDESFQELFQALKNARDVGRELQGGCEKITPIAPDFSESAPIDEPFSAQSEKRDLSPTPNLELAPNLPEEKQFVTPPPASLPLVEPMVQPKVEKTIPRPKAVPVPVPKRRVPQCVASQKAMTDIVTTPPAACGQIPKVPRLHVFRDGCGRILYHCYTVE